MRNTFLSRLARSIGCVAASTARALIASALGIGAIGAARAAAEAAIVPFSTASLGEPPAAWKFATLPNKVPTKFSIVEFGGAHVLKVESDQSYGNLVLALHVRIAERSVLGWR